AKPRDRRLRMTDQPNLAPLAELGHGLAPLCPFARADAQRVAVVEHAGRKLNDEGTPDRNLGVANVLGDPVLELLPTQVLRGGIEVNLQIPARQLGGYARGRVPPRLEHKHRELAQMYLPRVAR